MESKENYTFWKKNNNFSVKDIPISEEKGFKKVLVDDVRHGLSIPHL
jgi:hypothetical protein